MADENLRQSIVQATGRLEPAVQLATVAQLGLRSASANALLEFANNQGWLIVSHDVNTMKGIAEDRVKQGLGMRGLFLAPLRHPSRTIAEDLVLNAVASEAEEWTGKVVYLPL